MKPTITTSFLDAIESEALDSKHVQMLKEFRDTLEQDFKIQFGTEAFMKFYLGKTRVPVHSDYNYNEDNGIVTVTANEPTIETQDYNIRFPHDFLADEYGINFVKLHGPKFKPYFMASAMHQLTGNTIYDELAGDLLEEIEVGIQENIRDGIDPETGVAYHRLSDQELTTIINYLSAAVTCAIEHRRPDSLALSDTIDPMSQDENPGPRPEIT